jgi:hypothetical protein
VSTIRASTIRRASPTGETIDLPASEEGRLDAYREGDLDRAQLGAWAARFPDEIPLVNDELPWIAATLA